jgi:predicted secreted protein
MAHNGNIVIIKKGATTITCIRGASISFEQDLPDATSRCSNGWAEHINGLKSVSIDIDGVGNLAENANIDMLHDMIENGEKATVTYSPDPTVSANAGMIYFTGTASLGSLSIDAPNDDVITFSGSITFDGEVTKSTISISS